MVSREHNKASLREKLQILRSISNSDAINGSSIIVDASKYIEELKQKVVCLNQEISAPQTSSNVTVETLEKGFLVNVYSEKSCQGLLVSVLESFEELGLNVVEARISCTDSFYFEAVGGGENEEIEETVSAQVVKETILEAIKNWNESNDQNQ